MLCLNSSSRRRYLLQSGVYLCEQARQMLKVLTVDGTVEFNCGASVCTEADLRATLHMAPLR